MALMNEPMDNPLTEFEIGVLRDLKQIFPNHQERIIRQVVERRISYGKFGELLTQCIEDLINIYPSSDWTGNQTKNQGSGELSPVQKDVVQQLASMFPHLGAWQIKTSVRHPSNTFEPLSTPTLLQRCIDDLLDGRTAPDDCFYKDDDIVRTLLEEEKKISVAKNMPPEIFTFSAPDGPYSNAEKQPVPKAPVGKSATSTSSTAVNSSDTFLTQRVCSNTPKPGDASSDTINISDTSLNQSACSNSSFSKMNPEKQTVQSGLSALKEPVNKLERCLHQQQHAKAVPQAEQHPQPSGSNLRQTTESKVRQERFSIIEFSDSDSEELYPKDAKDEKVESDEDLPQFCIKNRDRDFSPHKPMNSYFTFDPAKSVKTYMSPISPSKFSLPLSKPSTVNTATPSTSAHLPGKSAITSKGDAPTLKTDLSATSGIGMMSLVGESVKLPQSSSAVSTAQGLYRMASPKGSSVLKPAHGSFSATPIQGHTPQVHSVIKPPEGPKETKSVLSKAGASLDVNNSSMFTATPLPRLGKSTVTTEANSRMVMPSTTSAKTFSLHGKATSTTDARSKPLITAATKPASMSASQVETIGHTAQRSTDLTNPRYGTSGSLKTTQANARPIPSLFTGTREKSDKSSVTATGTLTSTLSGPALKRTPQGKTFVRTTSGLNATTSVNASQTPAPSTIPKPVNTSKPSEFASVFDEDVFTTGVNAFTQGFADELNKFGEQQPFARGFATTSVNASQTPAPRTMPKPANTSKPSEFASVFDEDVFATGFNAFTQGFADELNKFGKQKPTSTSTSSKSATGAPVDTKEPWTKANWNSTNFKPNQWIPRPGRQPIVIKEVPTSCIKDPGTTTAGVTLQNTIPLQPPAGNEGTTVTIESLHRITYQGTNPAQKEGPVDPAIPGPSNVNPQPATPARKAPAATATISTAGDVIELTDESSNDSLDVPGWMINGNLDDMARGRAELPMDVDEYEASVVLLDDPDPVMPDLVNGHQGPMIDPGIFNAYRSDKKKKPKHRHKKHRYRGLSAEQRDAHYGAFLAGLGDQRVDMGAPDAALVDLVVPPPAAMRGEANPDPTVAVGQADLDVKNDVLALFPDIEPTHVDTLLARFTGPMALNAICNELLENTYPKKQTAPANPPPTAEAAAATAAAEGSRVDYFKDYKSVKIPWTIMNSYTNQTYTLLGNDYCWLSGKDIRKVMSLFQNYYAPSYQELGLIWNQAIEAGTKARPTFEGYRKYSQLEFDANYDTGEGKRVMHVRLLKNRRPVMKTKRDMLPELQREVDFVKTRLAELAKEADLEVAKQLNEQEYEDEGQCIECGCCYGEYPFESMIQCYEGHLFCQNCLNQYAKEAVFGQGKTDLKCMTDECDANYPKSQLVKALPTEMLDRYEERVQEDNINLADLADLVRCPHCGFAALLDPNDKVFACMKCYKNTCRHCKEDWEEHFGKRCDEVEKKDETKLRLAYEERMTQAKVRTCHKCKAQFTKEDGCNKMTCRCRATMCYICRKPTIDYNHFCRHARDPGKPCSTCKACSLWTNPEEDDNRAVKEIQKEAEEKRKEHGFTEEKLIGAPDEPPVKKAKH